MPAYVFEFGGEAHDFDYPDDDRAVKAAYNRARTKGEVRVIRDGALVATAPAPSRRPPDVEQHIAHVRAELRLVRARAAGLEAELAALTEPRNP